MSKDAVSAAYNLILLARIYTLAGEQDKAVDALRQLLDHPYHLTRDWLRIDPEFTSLRNYPGFQRLIEGG